MGSRFALAGWAVFAVACTAVQAQPVTAAPVRAEACTACHGPAGNSVVPSLPSIAGQPRVFIENQLVLIREGLRDVPAMQAVMTGMGDPEIVALAQHFAAQPVLPPPGNPQPDRWRAGAELARQGLCGTCHLPSYAGQHQVPRLAGQGEAYLVATMQMYRDHPAPGRDTVMTGVLRGLPDEALSNLAHYLAYYTQLGR